MPLNARRARSRYRQGPRRHGEFLNAVSAVMRTFDGEGIRWRSAASADGIKTAGVLASPNPDMARAGLMTTAAVIRWAAQETGKSEDEILAELRRSLTN